MHNVTITSQEPETLVVNNEAHWSAKISISAEGEFAPIVMERVNSLGTPFDLTWRRESWKPWDWKLVRATNPALELPAELY